MAGSGRTRRARDPKATREAILEAARSRLAQDGPDGLSLSEVARVAGVNRGTAYQHFQTRENLVQATLDWVSEQLYRAVFGDRPGAAERPVEEVDIPALTDRLATFAMQNPQICRIWLLQVLASEDPAGDLFWREYHGSIRRFAGTGLAQPDIDTEALTVIVLAGAFLWPVWAQAHDATQSGAARWASRFSNECLRLSMFGTLRPEHYPQIVRRLAGAAGLPPAPGGARANGAA